jgi:ribosomal 50S subunit-recycling heat shock protein
MRVDKYLKVSRLIKRRTLAKEICDAGRIEVNGRTAKAGTEVQVGDTIRIRFGTRILTVRIAKIAENARKELAVDLYEIVSEERIAGAAKGEYDDDEDGLED